MQEAVEEQARAANASPISVLEYQLGVTPTTQMHHPNNNPILQVS